MWGVSLCDCRMTETAQTPASVLKTHLTIEEQLERLQSRGLLIEDWENAKQVISRLGYYRLSGYFYPLRKTKPIGEAGRHDEFLEGASFELVAALADFDKGLRLIALDAIESIEVATDEHCMAIWQAFGEAETLRFCPPGK